MRSAVLFPMDSQTGPGCGHYRKHCDKTEKTLYIRLYTCACFPGADQCIPHLTADVGAQRGNKNTSVFQWVTSPGSHGVGDRGSSQHASLTLYACPISPRCLCLPHFTENTHGMSYARKLAGTPNMAQAGLWMGRWRWPCRAVAQRCPPAWAGNEGGKAGRGVSTEPGANRL